MYVFPLVIVFIVISNASKVYYINTSTWKVTYTSPDKSANQTATLNDFVLKLYLSFVSIFIFFSKQDPPLVLGVGARTSTFPGLNEQKCNSYNKIDNKNITLPNCGITHIRFISFLVTTSQFTSKPWYL